MTLYGWNITPGQTRLPIPGGTVNSRPISVPSAALVMAISVPALVGSATLKIQTLVIQLDDQQAEVWQDVSAFNLASGTPIALAGIPSNTTTTVPVTASGGGVIRFVASADQSSAPVDLLIGFMCL
ncbi:MAG TPA: hypothetical protein VN524_19410 [Hyphomicrobiaceae bacterium]|nr:hypothetical protein [Hyphomicrobiaceae bacterium]